MSTTLLKTDNTDSFTLHVGTTVEIKEENGNDIIQLGQVLYHVCIKDLVQADVPLHAGKIYRVQGTISVQEVSEDEAAALES